MPGGRPSAYRPAFVDQAYKLTLLGATDVELADFFGVSEQTLNAWKNRHPEFLESLTRGKAAADANVAERLYQRAMGYSHPAVKIFMPAGTNEPVYAPYTEHYPPDTQAASLWLRNRQPKLWRDKVDHHHHVNERDANELSDDELTRIARGGSDRVAGPPPRPHEPRQLH